MYNLCNMYTNNSQPLVIENCVEKNERLMAEVQPMVDKHGVLPPGFELETCDEDGGFSALQCRYGGYVWNRIKPSL